MTRLVQLGSVLLLVSLTLVSQVSAQTSWTNAGNGDWYLSANWSTGVPTLLLSTSVNNGGTAAADRSSGSDLGDPVTNDLSIGLGTRPVLAPPFATGDGAFGNGTAFTGKNGTYRWRAEDMNGSGCTNPDVINWTGIIITGLSNLEFSGYFAARVTGPVFENADDYIRIEYQIDGGGRRRSCV